LNTVDFVESRLLPKPATNRQLSRLLPIRSTLLPICRQCVPGLLAFDSLQVGLNADRQTLNTTFLTDQNHFVWHRSWRI